MRGARLREHVIVNKEFFPLYASCKYHIAIHFACAIISFEEKKLIFKIELLEYFRLLDY